MCLSVFKPERDVRMKLTIVSDYNELSSLAAQIFADAVKQNPTGAYGFATGSTPEGMYQKLTQMCASGEADLSRITAFNLDEYVPLAPCDPQSYSYYMATKLFDAVGVPAENRYIPRGDAPCPHAECIAYEQKIAEKGGIKLQILGIGTNCHIGFNEPHPSCFAAKTSYVQLAEETIAANSRLFDNISDVPTHAITMGLQTIMMAKQIMLLAGGESKALAMRDTLLGPITPMVPASVLQLHQNVIVIADKAAAKYLE